MQHWVKIITDADKVPYQLGKHDCLSVACAVVHARTGVNYWPRFAGYSTQREAFVVISKYGRSLKEAVSNTLQRGTIPAMLAQSGDLIMFRDRIDHLGVCMGNTVAVLGDAGIMRVSILDERNVCAWRI